MDLIITPENYVPSIDDKGNYIDVVPKNFQNGLICMCGSRKDHTYENSTKFSIHIKSKKHQQWIALLNQNKANHYSELLQIRELTENQKKIIQKLDNDIQKKNLTIDYLTELLEIKKKENLNHITYDLLNLN
jgi:hypothetical protein